MQSSQADILPNVKNLLTIGHVMDSGIVTRNGFENRQGILFVGAFRDQMYYNGDAIWYLSTCHQESKSGHRSQKS